MPHPTRENEYRLYCSPTSTQIYTHNTLMPFVSFRCRPTLFTLPPELLSRIAFNLSLHEYSFLSRTCSGFHRHLFRPAEILQFLKTRYRLSIESGSIIIFAYLANMQIRAPHLLERIFEDFFADSHLRRQEEEQKRYQILNRNINERAQLAVENESYNNDCIKIQRADSFQVHKNAEKARRQAKWDAVRMLGVLYALDKTHVGPTSSSTNALVLCGASDTIEQLTPTEREHEVFPEYESPQSCKTQISTSSSSSPTSETENSPYFKKTAKIQHQQAIEQECLMVTNHTQLMTGKSRRPFLLEPYESQNISPIDADSHRSVSFKRTIRNRPSSLMSGRDSTGQVFGHRRDRSISHTYGECKSASSSHTILSASAPSLATSSWQEFALDQNAYISSSENSYIGLFNTRKRSGIVGIKKYNKLRSKESQGKEKTFHRQIEVSDSHININYFDHDQSTRPSKGGSLSSSTHLLAIDDDLLISRMGGEDWDKPSVESSIAHNTSANGSDVRSRSTSSSTLSLSKEMDSGHCEQNNCQSYQTQQPQPILNRSDKIAFLTKYTDRMHRKLQALEIKDWKNEDIQRKKTYQLMIQHNDKTGEKDLVDFYLGRYGGSVRSSREQEQQQNSEIGSIIAA